MPKWIPIAALALVATLAVGVGLQRAQAEDDAQPDAEAQQASEPREVDLKVLADPSHEKMNQRAPAEYEVLFRTTEGDFTVKVTRKWAPIGADRFYSLVKNGYYDGTKFFRVVPGFVVQWGIHGDKDVNAAWYDPANKKHTNLKDDPVAESNTRGRLVFATAGPNTRTTQLFINLGDNKRLDDMGFAPFGEVAGEGMKVVEKLYDQYELFDPRFDRDPTRKISQGHIAQLGNDYLDEYFPKLDGIVTATIVEKEKQGD
ncbi:MAG: peptidylprolyl isomerase [Phycisphaeraceae bacterium]